jgi:hypothetical protein
MDKWTNDGPPIHFNNPCSKVYFGRGEWSEYLNLQTKQQIFASPVFFKSIQYEFTDSSDSEDSEDEEENCCPCMFFKKNNKVKITAEGKAILYEYCMTKLKVAEYEN